jgi:sugar transferase (PEP-CTERM/EpsH1 system associated)
VSGIPLDDRTGGLTPGEGDGPLRILYILPYIPSPIRVRPYQIIRHLAQQGHQVTVAALEDEFATDAIRRELKEICAAVHIVPHAKVRAAINCLLALPTPTPLWAAYCRSPDMARLLHDLTSGSSFDVAHVEHLRAARFAPDLGGLPRVLDAVDCITDLRRQILAQRETRGLSRLFAWEEWTKLRTYEPRAYRAFRRIAVTSEHDASALISLDPMHLPPVEVIPNGVDSEYFHPISEDKPDADCLVFSGKLSYIANEDAARFLLEEILPRLRRLRPNTHLILAGSGPSSALRAMAERAGGVTVTGFVEDLRPSIRRASVAVCPMRLGVGIQNKALEAMALGRPVVVSPLAARSLVAAERAGALRIAGTADEFAETCARWLSHPEEARSAGRAARKYVEEHHQWSMPVRSFTGLYRAALRDAEH